MAKRVNPHKFLSHEWYEWMHNNKKQIHDDFVLWTHDKAISSILQVGCGKHDFYHRVFSSQHYIGLDISPDVISHCLKYVDPNMCHAWECGDILTSGPWETDLVFSHNVIDHSPDPDLFIRMSIESAAKYAYIMSYRGWFPNIDEHKIEKGSDGYFYNDISVNQVRRLLDSLGYAYELKRVPTNMPKIEIQNELHIIVTK